jgi:predicted acetyltransferase
MINDISEIDNKKIDFNVAQFFVMYKYRRSGVGKQAFYKVLDFHRGKWQLHRHPKNLNAVYFWNKVIAEYTKGEYELFESHPSITYDDGTLGDIFFFDNSKYAKLT